MSKPETRIGLPLLPALRSALRRRRRDRGRYRPHRARRSGRRALARLHLPEGVRTEGLAGGSRPAAPPADSRGRRLPRGVVRRGARSRRDAPARDSRRARPRRDRVVHRQSRTRTTTPRIALPPALPARARYRAGASRRRASTSFPKMVSSALMFGAPLAIPVADIDHTDFLLVLGANPLASNGSLMTAPDFPGRLAKLRERGGRLVVVDPRRTETARDRRRHLFIKPGARRLSALRAGARALRGEARRARTARAVHEWRGSRRGAGARTSRPRRSRTRRASTPRSIRRLAREFAGAERAACYGRIGTCTQEFGTLASWLVDVLNVVTGNLDRPGGALFPRPAHFPASDEPRKRRPRSLRTLEEPRARAARVRGRTAGRDARRGDRLGRRRARARARHGRRQPGALDAERQAAREGDRGTRVRRLGRPLPERDDAASPT